MEKIKKNAKKIIIGAVAGILALTVLMLYLFIGVLLPYYNVPNKNKAVKKYDQASEVVNQTTYDALINSKKYSKLVLGVNKDGEVVFQHPHKAFKRLKKEYRKVWKYGDKKLKLKHLSKTYYIKYTDESVVERTIQAHPELEEQARIYQECLIIYSHSFNKHR